MRKREHVKKLTKISFILYKWYLIDNIKEIDIKIILPYTINTKKRLSANTQLLYFDF